MTSPIDRLEEALWGACVVQGAAPDEGTLVRWQTDELAHLRERFSVRPLPAEFDDLARRALAQWQEREQVACARLGMAREAFLSEFEKLREDYLGGGQEWQRTALSLSSEIHGAVRNMDWVNLFSWVLPNADRERAETHRMVGRMVTALFYVELLFKHVLLDDQSLSLRKIEARWRLVSVP
ncbi:hypothetical protein [uncultured Thiodictyon sp.]|uniref:hypothetical protein n=1 Tax=uncultured Thiodictyon sp. TaxID=1846217 RepID=UPI0025FC66AC|nr:hypothetical protein [uncultured Thiodictyon sp.]